MNDVTDNTVRYYYDGVNEIFEAGSTVTNKLRTYVHGISYVDERLMMMDWDYNARGSGWERPYYYTLDRMYNVRGLVDRAGSLIERYVYDPYGKPLIRECAGRGDLWGPDSKLELWDDVLVAEVIAGTRWDARADIDDDGDFDSADQMAFDAKTLL